MSIDNEPHLRDPHRSNAEETAIQLHGSLEEAQELRAIVSAMKKTHARLLFLCHAYEWWIERPESNVSKSTVLTAYCASTGQQPPK